MVGAWYVNVAYVLAFAWLVIYLVRLIDQRRQDRRRRERIADLIEWRALIDAREPQRWDDRAAHPWERSA